jgi:hypothetical protein
MGVYTRQRGDDRDELPKLLGKLSHALGTGVTQLLPQGLPQDLAQRLSCSGGSRETLDAAGIQGIVAHRP